MCRLLACFVLDCVLFPRFESNSSAQRAKQQLDGADIYAGCCTLKIEFAKVCMEEYVIRCMPSVYDMSMVNPLPTIGNSLKKQKSLYKVLTPSIKPPYKFLWAYGSS